MRVRAGQKMRKVDGRGRAGGGRLEVGGKGGLEKQMVTEKRWVRIKQAGKMARKMGGKTDGKMARKADGDRWKCPCYGLS